MAEGVAAAHGEEESALLDFLDEDAEDSPWLSEKARASELRAQINERLRQQRLRGAADGDDESEQRQLEALGLRSSLGCLRVVVSDDNLERIHSHSFCGQSMPPADYDALMGILAQHGPARSQEQLDLLARAVSHTPFFVNLPHAVRVELCALMRLRRAAADEDVFVQGEDSTDAYVVCEGSVMVRRTRFGEFWHIVRSLYAGESFGELPELYRAEDARPSRQVTVTTLEPCVFLVLPREIYPHLRALRESHRLEVSAFLTRHEALRPFRAVPPAALAELAACTQLRVYPRGSVLLCEGVDDTHLHIVRRGYCRVLKAAPHEGALRLFELSTPISEGAVFGGMLERELSEDERARARSLKHHQRVLSRLDAEDDDSGDAAAGDDASDAGAAATSRAPSWTRLPTLRPTAHKQPNAAAPEAAADDSASPPSPRKGAYTPPYTVVSDSQVEVLALPLAALVAHCPPTVINALRARAAAYDLSAAEISRFMACRQNWEGFARDAVQRVVIVNRGVQIALRFTNAPDAAQRQTHSRQLLSDVVAHQQRDDRAVPIEVQWHEANKRLIKLALERGITPLKDAFVDRASRQAYGTRLSERELRRSAEAVFAGYGGGGGGGGGGGEGVRGGGRGEVASATLSGSAAAHTRSAPSLDSRRDARAMPDLVRHRQRQLKYARLDAFTRGLHSWLLERPQRPAEAATAAPLARARRLAAADGAGGRRRMEEAFDRVADGERLFAETLQRATTARRQGEEAAAAEPAAAAAAIWSSSASSAAQVASSSSSSSSQTPPPRAAPTQPSSSAARLAADTRRRLARAAAASQSTPTLHAPRARRDYAREGWAQHVAALARRGESAARSRARVGKEAASPARVLAAAT